MFSKSINTDRDRSVSGMNVSSSLFQLRQQVLRFLGRLRLRVSLKDFLKPLLRLLRPIPDELLGELQLRLGGPLVLLGLVDGRRGGRRFGFWLDRACDGG